MKILFITQFLPYPPDSGGKIKTWEVLRLLAKDHQIFLLSFVERRKDLKWEGEVRTLCHGLKTFVTPIITQSHKELKKKAILGFFNPKPFRVQKYFLKEAADFIRKLTKKENFDAIYCDHLTSAQYLSYVYQWQKKLKIYDEHNISSEGFLGYAKYEKNPLEKLAYLAEGIKFWFYERRAIPVFDQILTISQADKEKISGWGIDPAKINFLPIPFKLRPQFNLGSKNILFVGLLSWWPNKDAVLWFYYSVFTVIRKKIPQVKFLVIGANPPEEIKKIGIEDSQVMVTGYVKDISPYYKKAGVFVVPIRAGAGVRIKILDALASGLPVVATKMATTGIKVKNKEEILIAEEPEEFARSVIKVLEDKKLAQKLSVSALQLIKVNYNQKKTTEILEKSSRASLLTNLRPKRATLRKMQRS